MGAQLHIFLVLAAVCSALLSLTPFVTAYFIPLDTPSLIGLFLLAAETLYYLFYLAKSTLRWRIYKPSWPAKRIWLPFFDMFLKTLFWLLWTFYSGRLLELEIAAGVVLLNVVPAALLTYGHFVQLRAMYKI
jgi:hypothetical protein